MSFDWDEETQGLILGAFYYGYMISQIPGGILADKYGCKWVLGSSILTAALCTLLLPWAVKTGGAAAAFAIRALQGFGDVSTFSIFLINEIAWTVRHIILQ